MDSKTKRTEARRYWKISTGRGEDHWSQFITQHIIAILGPRDFGELSPANEATVRAEVAKWLKPGQRLSYHMKIVWYFFGEMKRGDLVCAYKRKTVLGWGEIVGDYDWDESLLQDYPQVRRVEWKSVEELPTSRLPDQLRKKLRLYDTIIPLTAEEFALIQNRGRQSAPDS